MSARAASQCWVLGEEKSSVSNPSGEAQQAAADSGVRRLTAVLGLTAHKLLLVKIRRWSLLRQTLNLKQRGNKNVAPSFP